MDIISIVIILAVFVALLFALYRLGCLWQDKPTYNCSAKVHNSASSLGQKKKPLRAS